MSLLTSYYAFSQVTYQRYVIENFGSIEIPSNLELEHGYHKKYAENVFDSLSENYKFTLPMDMFAFHQLGLNERDPKAVNTYTRLMYNKRKGKKGEYRNLKTLELSPNDIINFSDNLKNQAITNFQKSNALTKGIKYKMLEWYGAQIVTIHGNMFLKYSMRRNPDTYVCVFDYFDAEYLYQFTISYRMKEKEIWKPIFEQVMNSLVISE